MSDREYYPIRVSTLRGDQKISFNAYVRVGSHYVLYCRKGDSFEGDRLKKLKEKKLEKLWIDHKEKKLYDHYLNSNIDQAFDLSTSKDILSRTQVLEGYLESLSSALIEDPNDDIEYENAKNSCNRLIDFIQKENLALKCLLSFDNPECSITQHGVNVAAISLALADKLGLVKENREQIVLMGVGALIHDIGHLHTALDLTAPVDNFSEEDLNIYRKHPMKAVDTLRRIKHFDTTVLNIIMEHEEHIDGSGFPKGLQQREIDPLSLIVSVVNYFDRLVSFQREHPIDALKDMLIDKMGQLPLDHMKAMQELLLERQCLTKATR